MRSGASTIRRRASRKQRNPGQSACRTGVLPRVANGGGGGSRTRVRSPFENQRYVAFRTDLPAGVAALSRPPELPVRLRSPGGCSSPGSLQAWVTPTKARPSPSWMPGALKAPGPQLSREGLAEVVGVVGIYSRGPMKATNLATPINCLEPRRNRYAPMEWSHGRERSQYAHRRVRRQGRAGNRPRTGQRREVRRPDTHGVVLCTFGRPPGGRPRRVTTRG